MGIKWRGFIQVWFCLTTALLPATSSAICEDFRLSTAKAQADRLATLIKQKRELPPLGIDLDVFKSATSALDELNWRRWLQPAPAVVEGYYTGLLGRALELELASRPEATPRRQAISLIIKHPRLFALMVSDAFQFTRSYGEDGEMTEFYDDFVRDVSNTLSGHQTGWDARLFKMSRLSLVRITPKAPPSRDDTALLEEFKDSLDRLVIDTSGALLFALPEGTDPPSWIAAANPLAIAALSNLFSGIETRVDELSIEDADADGRLALAMAQRIDIQAFQSSRTVLFGDSEQLLSSLDPNSQPLSQTLHLSFREAVDGNFWTPQGSIGVKSRREESAIVDFTRASQLILLDSDLRLVTIEWQGRP